MASDTIFETFKIGKRRENHFDFVPDHSSKKNMIYSMHLI